MREVDRILLRVIFFFSCLLTLFSLILPVYAFIPNLIERAIHLGLVIPLVFLRGNGEKNKPALFLNLLISALGLSLCLYIIIDFRGILEQYGIVKNHLQTLMGLLMVLIVLESARRMIKPILPTITLLFLLYAIFGLHILCFFGRVKFDFSQ